MIFFVVMAIISFFFTVYVLLVHYYQFWYRRRVPYVTPNSLFFGNFGEVFSGKSSVSDHMQKLYKDLAPHTYGGIFLNYRPVLYVRDRELIRRILTRDSRHFAQRTFGMANERDPLSQQSHFLTGRESSALRHKLSMSFTSDQERTLFGKMKACADKVEKYVEKKARAEDRVNVTKLTTRYVTDVICSCMFGDEVDPLNNNDKELPLIGKPALIPSRMRTLYNRLLKACAKPLWIVGHSPLPESMTDFYGFLVETCTNYEEQLGKYGFLNLVNHRRDYDLSIGTQFSLFCAAGLETSAGTLSFILYEVAENPYVQEQLCMEIDSVLARHGWEISEDCLREMYYMEQVFNETMRLYPALPFLGRICTENYRFPDSDGWVMTKGEMVFLAVRGLHRDPQYYYDPDIFNPDNFSPEMRASRPACAFLPFGDGPRNCIGAQLSEMLVKLVLTTVLRKYWITVSPRMKLPIKIKPGVYVTTSKHDILLNFNKRNK